VRRRMADGSPNDRAYAHALARRYFYDRNVTVEAMVEMLGETSDPLIARLLELVVQEPARTGRGLTVSQRDYEKNYWPYVADVLIELEKGDLGESPAPRRPSLRRIVWSSVLFLVMVAGALEHLGRFVQYLRNEEGSMFARSFSLAMGTFLAVLAVLVLRAILHFIRLRTQLRGDLRGDV
ncbi:MAG TPA: hypothetical protein VF701_15810, partial [Thermoanaerobaculia bacterium]